MTYWNNKGKHQANYDELYSKLVPDSGEAETDHGELLRAISKLYYDCYNNGGCNMDIYESQVDTLEDWYEEIQTRMENPEQFDLIIRQFRQHANEDNMYLDFDKNALEAVTDAVILIVANADKKESTE